VPDRDFVIILNEWFIEPGTSRPDPNTMGDFNILTMNHKAFPGTAALVAETGDRVRMRFGNLSAMDHHPIHLHGYSFETIETDGGQIPSSARWPETTVLVPVGATRAVELVANAPGDWAMHCHMTHHIMNQMGHGLPNLIGIDVADLDPQVQQVVPGYMTMGHTGMSGHGEHAAKSGVPRNSIPMGGGAGPYGYIDMGGMFTVFKVRDRLESYDDPGWYQPPQGTIAEVAPMQDLTRDGIAVGMPMKKETGGGHHH
jgi:hypothetical protein